MPSVTPLTHLPVSVLGSSSLVSPQTVNPAFQATGAGLAPGLAQMDLARGLPDGAVSVIAWDVSLAGQSSASGKVSGHVQLTVVWNPDHPGSSAPWFVSVTFGGELGQQNSQSVGPSHDAVDPKLVEVSASTDGHRADLHLPSPTDSDLGGSSNPVTPSLPGTGQQNLFTGSTLVTNAQPGTNSAQTFGVGTFAEGSIRAPAAQQVVVVPVVLVGEVPLVTVVDVVEQVVPPAPSLPAVGPMLSTFPTTTRIESGGGDNLPLPDKQQLYEQMFYWLLNSWWAQQPGPSEHAEGGAAGRAGAPVEASSPAVVQPDAEAGLASSMEQAAEKQSPVLAPAAEENTPATIGEKSFAGAAVLGLVLGGYWARYSEEETEDHKR